VGARWQTIHADRGDTLLAKVIALDPSFHGVPVDVFRIAGWLGVGVSLDPSTSAWGELRWEGGRPVIRLRASDALVRQRFSCAHELGHLFLHGEGHHFRDDNATLGTDPKEVAANRFAADLLMPANWVQELNWPEIDLVGSARSFGVSQAAMEVRLRSLRMIP